MKSCDDAMKRERGSVTLEYVLLLCMTVTAVYGLFIDEFYSPTAGFHGVLGDALRGVMQRILEGIAMPLP
jgi:hypothetical protein